LCRLADRGRTTAELVEHYYLTKHRPFTPPAAVAEAAGSAASGGPARATRMQQQRVLYSSLQSRELESCAAVVADLPGERAMSQ
jgi:hypothetical protein